MTEAEQRERVCIGFDCMRIALGMDTQHFDLDTVVRLLGECAEEQRARCALKEKP